MKPVEETKPIVQSKLNPPVAPPKQDEPPKKISSLFAGADDDDEDDVQPPKPAPAKLPDPPKLLETKSAPVQPTIPKPPAPVEEESAGVTAFKNSLSSLLQKANPHMPGVARKATIQQKKPAVEEEEAKEKIKFDIFNKEDEGESPDYKKKTVLDNVSALTDLTL